MSAHVEYVANGLGAPSVLLDVWANEGVIPSSVSITADTGDELDRLWNTGERTTAREYWERIVRPLVEGAGRAAYFVRAVDRAGDPLPSLGDAVDAWAKTGTGSAHQPLHGRDGGRMQQTCTDRWKAAALRQHVRRLGAKTACSVQGIHFGEAARRVKGDWLEDRDGWTIYRTPTGRKDAKTGRPAISGWLTHYYPFVDRRLNREAIRQELDRRGVPYLITSECDSCPHKDAARWLRTSPDVLVQIAAREARFEGQWFYTARRIPLLDAVEQMRREQGAQPGLFDRDTADFGCDTGICGI
jgi:hypothetical protein